MKKICLTLLLPLLTLGVFAQKYAYVDTDYIMNNIPTYETAQQQLNELSDQWKNEVDEMKNEIEKMYEDFKAEKVFLTEELKMKREEEIIQKEKEMRELQQKYFGRDGMLFKKRKELLKPIQDDIFNAVKEIAQEGNYAVIFDTANAINMLYTDPKYDKSDDVLRKLGYKN
ncbi:MAG: OmpH family outer membrane protein [Candidatus Delongbacteria bacterium]|jgi:outer membrane protein|nr:OmpH family outer membrane protein [Candidatus Delongbacteria bacterium]